MDGAAAHLPAHRLLRERTRAAHDAAEATAGMQALMSGAMDEAGYVDLLAAQRRLFREWEGERAAAIAAIATAWPYESRIPALDNDITAPGGVLVGATLGAITGPETATDPAAPREKMSRAGRAPTGGCGADAIGGVVAVFWGELYVIEGSALGAQVIVRHLRQRFPARPHHYYGLGEHAPGRWRRFQDTLDRALPDTASQQLALAGAQRMFARFQRTLQDPGHHV
jgi:heme oxygenase (biliverdin-IX-beta and delta-forming)